MKHYKSPQNEVWAYEEDGSQDHLIPEDFIAITDQQAFDLNAQKLSAMFVAQPSPTKEELLAKILEIQAQLESL